MLVSVHEENHTATPARDSIPEAASESIFDAVKARSSVDYLVRTQQQLLMQQNALADTKANIMITASSIVITISLSQLEQREILLMLLPLAGGALLSLVMAIMAVLPSVSYPARPGGGIDKEHPRFNLMFFGHLARMELVEFQSDLAALLTEDRQIYESISRNIHGLSGVLLRKYSWLRWSYGCFLAGALVATLVALPRMLGGA